MASLEAYIKEEPEVYMGAVMTIDLVEEVVDPPYISIVLRLVMSHFFSLRCMLAQNLFWEENLFWEQAYLGRKSILGANPFLERKIYFWSACNRW
jgi:hypothetical protein